MEVGQNNMRIGGWSVQIIMVFILELGIISDGLGIAVNCLVMDVTEGKINIQLEPVEIDVQSLYQLMSKNKQESFSGFQSPKQTKKSLPFGISTISEKEEPSLGSEMLGANARYRQQQEKMLSDIQKSGLMEEELSSMNINKIQQFTEAWKSQSNFSILLIEKLSLIVNNYFKMLSEIGQRNQQLQILIIYNKSLIQILNKFEDHQRKLIQKLRTMEEFNLKVMKELCILKKRHFEPPEIKTEQSLFAKFSLRNLKYEIPKKQPEKPDEKYQQKIENLFKQYLLEKTEHYIPVVEQTLKQQKALLKQNSESKPSQLKIQSNIDELQDLLHNIITYNKELNNVSCDNMFDLYELKWEIRNQMKLLSLELKEDEDGENKERMFVNDVKKIHVGLKNMSEGELQNYLKKEKEIRKKMKKQRVKEQEIFLRACEEAQNQNIDLKEDIKKLKEKILHLEDELSHARAQIEFKSMKQKRASKSSLNLDESSFEHDSKVPGKKLQEYKKLKQNYDKLNKLLEDKHFQVEVHDNEKSKMVSRLKDNNMEVEESMKCVEVMELVFNNYEKIKKEVEEAKLSALLGMPEKEDDSALPISPQLGQKSILFGFNPSAMDNLKKTSNNNTRQDPKNVELTQRVNTNNSANSIANLNNKLNEMEEELEDARTKNNQLEQQLLKKDEEIKNLNLKVAELQKAIEDLDVKEKDRIKNQTKLMKQINAKNDKIKEYAKQLDSLKEEFKSSADKIKQQEFFRVCAEKLAKKIMKAVQVLVQEDFTSQKFLIVMDKMFANLKGYVDDYKLETKKDGEFGNFDHLGQFQHHGTQEEREEKKKIKTSGLDDSGRNPSSKESSEHPLNLSIKSLKSSKKSEEQKSQKQGRLKEPPQKVSVVKRQLSSPHFNLMNREKSFNESENLLQNSKNVDRAENEGEVKDSLIFKSTQKFQMEKQRKPQTYKMQKKDKVQLNEKEEKLSRQKIAKVNRRDRKQKLYEKQKQIKEGLTKKQKQSEKSSLQSHEQQKFIGSNSLDTFYNKIGSNSMPNSGLQKKDKVMKNQIKTKSEARSEYEGEKNLPQSSGQSSERLMKKESAKSGDSYFIKINGNLNPYAFHVPSQESLRSSRSIQNSQTKFHPSSFLSSSSKNKGEQNSILIKSDRNSQNAQKSSNSQRPQFMNSVNLTLSEDDSESAVGILPKSCLQVSQNKKTGQPNENKSALEAGVQLKLVSKMFQKFQRLCNDEDAIDFHELFQRYKQALKCLQKSQQLNKMNEIRYQKFIDSVKQRQKADPSFSMEKRLHFLERHVLEQEEQLIRQKNEFENVFVGHLRESQNAISQHIKLMRRQSQPQRRVGL